MILYGHRLKNHNNYLSVVSGSYYLNIVLNESRPKYYDFFAYDKLPYTDKTRFEALLPCNMQYEPISISDLSFIEKTFLDLHKLIYNFALDKKINATTPWWTIDKSFTEHTERLVHSSYIEDFNRNNNYV